MLRALRKWAPSGLVSSGLRKQFGLAAEGGGKTIVRLQRFILGVAPAEVLNPFFGLENLIINLEGV